MDNVFNKNMGSFPEHEFSHLIDPKMSFDNSYVPDNPRDKHDLVTKLINIRCDGELTLEPRLQEYMKKKKYYRDNNIKPCVALEKEFQITKDDVRRMKRFLNDKKDFYLPNKSKLSCELRHKKPSFPSSRFPSDTRVLKPDRPEKHKLPANRGMFATDHPDEFFYEDPLKQDNFLFNGDQMLKSDDLNNKGFSFNDTRFDPRTDPNICPGHNEEHHRKDSQFYINWGQGNPIKKNKKKMITRKNRYIKKQNVSSGYEDVGGYDDWDSSPGSMDELYSQSERYGQFSNPQQTYKSKKSVPSISKTANRNLDMSDYNTAPYLYGSSDLMDVEQETCLISGMPTRTKKSYGFRNPVEHQFQFVNDEFNTPEHTVLPFPRGGISARLQNTKTSRPYNHNDQDFNMYNTK